MIIAIALGLSSVINKCVFRLYLLMESGVFIELENGATIELEA